MRGVAIESQPASGPSVRLASSACGVFSVAINAALALAAPEVMKIKLG